MPYTELGEITEESENLQKPQNHCDDDDGVHDPFDLVLHGDIAINQPQQDSDDYQSENNIDKRHTRPSWISARLTGMPMASMLETAG
jgi:hypothetical protein